MQRIVTRSVLATAAIAAVAAGVLLGWQRETLRERIVAASSIPERRIEPRLSGSSRWAPLSRKTRDAELFIAAARIVGVTRNDHSSEGIHAAAVAHLITGHAAKAISTLRAFPERERTTAMWNDIAAAHYVAADKEGTFEHLTRALVSVDQALRREPRFREALFNRALIMERLQLADSAAEAWRRYLIVEDDAEWETEARHRLDAIVRRPPVFSAAIGPAYARLESGDREVARGLLRLDAGEARYFFETEGLARWGEAVLRSDAAKAARHLHATRVVAEELIAFNGDPLLADSVAVINRARGEGERALAQAHVKFRDARVAYRERRAGESEAMLRGATDAFASAGSPMAGEARVYTAVAMFGQNRADEAEAEFHRIGETAPRRYRAMHAYVQWQQAGCFMARADWGPAIELLNRAIAAFTSLREPGNAGYLRNILSQVYDAVGDRQRAAQCRLLALRELGKVTNYRLEHAVSGIVYDAMQRKDWPAAMSFLNIESEIAKNVRDKELLTQALLTRALLSSRFSDAEAAASDLREAASIILSVEDAPLRTKLQTEQAAAAALISTRPETAIRLLTDVLRFHEQKGWRMLMPDLYLRRGRMHLALGDGAQAAADFESGIAELERHRQSLPEGEPRWGVLDAAEDLFDEAIEAALRDNPEKAFRYAERERARSLMDAARGHKLFNRSALPRGTLVIEYAVLPRELILFAIDRDGFRVERKEIARDELVSLAERFDEAIRDDNAQQIHVLASRFHDLLIAPVRDSVDANEELVFVPDPVLSAISFAALTDGVTGTMLVEQHTISVSPSAGLHLQRRARRSTANRRRVLIVENPTNPAMPSLSAAASEASAIARAYEDPWLLSGRAATRVAFLEQVRDADVLHFAGHGVSAGNSAALLFASATGESGHVDVAAISRFDVGRIDVVVLAACESTRGRIVRGEGALSVAYAFLQAGAPAAVATLWPISDDDSADFFPRLHRHLARGAHPAEALRQTQLEVLRQRGRRSSLWAAVQVIGY